MTVSRKVAASAAVASAAASLALIMTVAFAQPAPVLRTAAGDGPSAVAVTRLSGRDKAFDASPDPAGKVIYFTVNGSNGPGILRVSAAGGKRRRVLAGAPLRGPTGLAVSNDGKRLFVADRRGDHIIVVPVRGGRPHVLRGTAGSAPRGLEIQTRGGKEFVVFTGKDPRDGRPAVLRIGARGAARPTVLLKGAPLRHPDGVAISKGGAIYVTDHGAGGRVLRIEGKRVRTVASAIRLGNPGGIALTLDESKLLISSLNKARRTAQILILDTTSGRASTFDDVIGRNHSAGGLHRARAAAPMGWCDVSRSGRVYRVEP